VAFNNNGRNYQHGTMDVRVLSTGDEFAFKTIKKFMCKVKAEKKGSNASSGEQDSYTIDNEKTEASMTVERREWFDFIDWCNQQFPDVGVGEIELDASISYGNTPTKLRQDTCDCLMFNEVGIDSENNQDAHTIELPLFVLKYHPYGGDFIRYKHG
jgi:hypothetical protein